MGTMTRVRVFKTTSPEELEKQVNDYLQALESEQLGVKSIHYAVAMKDVLRIYSAMVVYGNGPKTTQRWAGQAT